MKQAVYILLCIICWGLWGFLPKIATEYIPGFSIMIYELSAGIIIALIFFIYKRPAFNFRKWDTHFAMLTGFFGFLGLIFFILALELEKASVIAPLTGLYPIGAVLLGIIILKERYSFINYAGIVLALAAICLLSS